MTPDELRPILHGYRKQVEQGWSKATAHPSFEGADGSPVGQCGVTSAWLKLRLLEDHGIAATYCQGRVYQTDGGVVLNDHCWLVEWNDLVVIDLTADQPPLGREPVICDAYGVLFRQGIDYIPVRYINPEQLRASSVQARLALLESALS